MVLKQCKWVKFMSRWMLPSPVVSALYARGWGLRVQGHAGCQRRGPPAANDGSSRSTDQAQETYAKKRVQQAGDRRALWLRDRLTVCYIRYLTVVPAPRREDAPYGALHTCFVNLSIRYLTD